MSSKEKRMHRHAAYVGNVRECNDIGESQYEKKQGFSVRLGMHQGFVFILMLHTCHCIGGFVREGCLHTKLFYVLVLLADAEELREKLKKQKNGESAYCS